jgi:hypothetical protein
MATSTKNMKSAANSTLNFVEIAEIRDSAIVLREGQMRGVMAVSSANFALKSPEEQESIISTYQGVLNSLEFPVQILIQSRKLDLTTYIQKLKVIEDTITNDLLRDKMQEYQVYIQELLKEVNIMKKDFYVIVGYEPLTFKSGGFNNFLRAFQPTKVIKQKQEEFIKNRRLLMSRVDQVASRFGSLGLTINLLNTEQLIALMYNSYNPDVLNPIRLEDVSQIDIV